VTQAANAVHVELEVESLDAKGRGVARDAEGKVVFIEDALGGERVRAVRLQSKRSYEIARTVEVLRASSGRRTPRCPHFGVCGGCATQHADAATQVAAKQRGLEENLRRIGKVRPETLLRPIYGEEWGYRHRARLSAHYVANRGGALVGFHERHSSFVVETSECRVLPEHVSRLIPALRELIDTLSIRKRLPQVELAVGEEATVLVFRNLQPPAAADEDALRAFAVRHGICLWLQPGGPESAQPFHPPAPQVLHYALPEFGVRIAFRPTDFTQVNHAVNRVLVSRALRLLDPHEGERIGDLFCGLGNFSLPIARSGATVLGIDGSAALVERARQNARENGLAGRAEFVSDDLFKLDAEKLAALGPFDKVLVDPPRDGAIEIMIALPAVWPRRIVYVSCDTATLARDAGYLVHEKRFRFVAAGVVNMFPHTAHVESIALFERGQ
jgi:23S rRNA (uracil1939-C5)-methyltransferase